MSEPQRKGNPLIGSNAAALSIFVNLFITAKLSRSSALRAAL
jgi:hypothetical protein